MKMTPTATALLLAATALPTMAQTTQGSVTLFGVVDLALRQVKNDSSQTRLEAGGLQSGRLGVRGVEDLGGGLKAGFHLEGEIAADTGNSSGFNWQRRSTVSLLGGFGEVRLGRDKVPSNLTWDDFDPFRDTGVGRSSRLAAASGVSGYAFSRANNSIGYFTPALGGFFGQLMVAQGEGSDGNKTNGLRAGYKAGPLFAAVTFANAEITAGNDAKIWSIGGTYDIKAAKFWGFYNSADAGAASQTNLLLGVSVPFGKTELRASVQAMDGKEAISSQSAKMFALGAVHNLSKRTAVYGTYSSISNDGTKFTVASGSSLTTGRDSSGFEIGLRHAF